MEGFLRMSIADLYDIKRAVRRDAQVGYRPDKLSEQGPARLCGLCVCFDLCSLQLPDGERAVYMSQLQCAVLLACVLPPTGTHDMLAAICAEISARESRCSGCIGR